jgi:Uma2 family endonuclease
MGVVERVKTAGAFDVDRYMAFLEDRPREERWQLVDGVAQRMTPPTVVHQHIAQRLARLLNEAIDAAALDVQAYSELGVRLPATLDFQPEPDVAVIPAELPDGHWVERFFLIAEILSRSNDVESMARKVELYCSHPDNRHVLVIDQDTIRVTHRARDADWRPIELGEADRLTLPEFGFDVAVREIYRGTKLAPRR